MIKKVMALLCATVFVLSACSAKTDEKAPDSATGNQQQEEKDSLDQFALPASGEEIAVIKTNMGDIKVRLFPEAAPKAVENFTTLAKQGYYDGTIFHRVIDTFMIQGGDPQGTGAGGESMWGEPFEDEFSTLLHNYRGALSMANSGENSNGSQFFIVQNNALDESVLESYKQMRDQNTGSVTKRADIQGNQIKVEELYADEVLEKYREVGGAIHLDFMHTVFGQVYEGIEVVDKIAAVETTQPGVLDKPVEDIVIETIEITTAP